jgi:hypothetical protein
VPRALRTRLALAAVPVLLLSACASGGDAGVEVTGEVGETPEVSIPDSEPPEELQVDVLVDGDGPPVESGSLLLADYHGVEWDSGEVFDSSFERGEPAGFGIGVGSVITGWDEGLVGVPVGSRVQLVVPPEQAYGESGAGDIPPDATLVFVVDVIDAISHDDNPGGSDVRDSVRGGPTVTGTPPEQPTIDMDGALPQSPTRTTLLVEGSGERIRGSDTLAVGVTQADYTTGEVSSTRDGGAPLSITPDQLPGLRDAVVGENVGTRVLTELSGADGQGTPLVIVIDVLARY